jgi:hypothetical protein
VGEQIPDRWTTALVLCCSFEPKAPLIISLHRAEVILLVGRRAESPVEVRWKPCLCQLVTVVARDKRMEFARSCPGRLWGGLHSGCHHRMRGNRSNLVPKHGQLLVGVVLVWEVSRPRRSIEAQCRCSNLLYLEFSCIGLHIGSGKLRTLLNRALAPKASAVSISALDAEKSIMVKSGREESVTATKEQQNLARINLSLYSGAFCIPSAPLVSPDGKQLDRRHVI